MSLSISISKEALASALDFVAYIADAGPYFPAIGTTLIKTVRGRLSIACNDSTVLATSLVDCEIVQDGEAIVDARRLGDLVRVLPNKQTLWLSVDQAQLLVEAGTSRFKLPTRAARSYSMLDAPNSAMARIEISSERLGMLLTDVAHAMGVAEARSDLNGAHLAVKDGALWVVATDGFQLAISRETVKCEHLVGFEVIVPYKSVQLAITLLATTKEDVTLAFGHQQFHLYFNSGAVFYSKGLAVEFPDWQRIIPSTTTTITVSANKLHMALMMVRTWIDRSDPGPNASCRLCSVVFCKTCIQISHADVAFCEIPADSNLPDNLRLCMNVDAFVTGLEAITTRDATMRLGVAADGRSVLLRPLIEDYPLVVLAPVKT